MIFFLANHVSRRLIIYSYPDVNIGVCIIEDSEIHAEWLNEKLCEQEEFLVFTIDRLGLLGISSAKLHQPDIVLLDCQLPDITGIEVARKIKAYSTAIKIFALTSHTETAIIERMVADKNIDAIAIKGSDYFENTFLTSIKCVAQGGSFIDPSLLKTVRNSRKIKRLAKLTKRKFEVFIQVNIGNNDEEIARRHKSYSYGANTIRDGITIGTQRVTRPLVSPAEIMALK